MLPTIRSPLTLLPILLAAGCGAAPATPRAAAAAAAVSTEQTDFPTRETIAQIAAAPVPAHLSDEKSRDVPTWDLTGPLPDAVERVPPQDDSPWGKLFAEAAAARGDAVVPTEAMRCAAREHAAFYLANDARPAEMLQRFIAARCGAPTTLGGASLQVITGDERIPDERLFAQFQAQAKAMIDKTLAAGRLEAGLAYVRKGGKAVIALSIVPQTVRLERTPIVPGPDGKIVLRGEAIGAATGLRALVNRGRYGYADCAVSPAVKLPRFEITCETARDDEVAWLSVSALPPGRVLGAPVLEMLLWPSGAPGKTYARIARGAGEAPGASPELLVEEINRVRAEAKLPPLRLAEQESRTASRLAPHYFGALDGDGGNGVADQVALGLLAGWEVDGMVRSGHFVSSWLSDASSPSEVVRVALTRPVGRETLLDPGAERVAVGPHAAERGRGALFTTYALFDAYRHDGDAKAIAARLGAARVERGVARPRMLVDLSDAAERAARTVQSGQRSPQQALAALLQQSSDRLGRSVRGWVAETTSLERMKLPDEMLTLPSLTLGIGVAHRRPQGQPWGRFVVLAVITEEGAAPMTARAEGAHGG